MSRDRSNFMPHLLTVFCNHFVKKIRYEKFSNHLHMVCNLSCLSHPKTAKHICFENTPNRSPTIHVWSSPACMITVSISSRACCISDFLASTVLLTPSAHTALLCWHLIGKTYVWPGDLDLWPWPSNLTWISFHLTYTQAQARTHDAKTVTPITDAGCNKVNVYYLSNH